MEEIKYKVPNGKLLRINLKKEKEKIKEIEIHGDFFIHPEEKISEIEDSLKEIKSKDVKKTLEKLIQSEDIDIIGFSPKDLEKAIKGN